MKKKLKIFLILMIVMFLSMEVIGLFRGVKELKGGVLTKGRILYKTSGLKKKDQKKADREQDTAMEDATDDKVLLYYEFWTLDGKRHIGNYYPVSPNNVKSGVSYGAKGIEFTGSYAGTINTDFFILCTGQTNSYLTNDDGMLRKGYTGGYTNADGSWDGTTRFTDHANGTVTDNVTKLMWTKDANLYEVNWINAVTNAKNCTVGGYSDWRLPNIRELHSLIDYGNSDPPLPTGHPFQDVEINYYWSSTSRNASPSQAWDVGLSDGLVYIHNKVGDEFVWYCRPGQ